MSSTTEKIKDRLHIVELVSSYVKLQKAGVNYKACCPFHNEKTPSFVVSPVRDTYHCFGCNKGGDIFSFVEEMEGVDFKGALKILAERTGVSIEFQPTEKKEEKDRLYALLDDCATFYQLNLTQEKDALAYLYGRGLKPETLKTFRVGFAQDSWDACYTFLKNKSYTDEEMEKAGMIVRKQSDAGARGYYDRFRGRIMFPLCDSAGRVVAFSGRIFGADEKKEGMGKYVNSPETELFHKSNILFGYDKAKQVMRKEQRAILVEGQMDLIMAHQEGSAEVVAASGTAFTEQHAALIARFSEALILALDADEAGLAATKKAALIALRKGLDVRVARMESGLDPADVILKDVARWHEAIEKSVPVVDFFIDVCEEKYSDTRTFKLKSGEMVLPLIKNILSPIDQAHFVEEFAKRLGVPRRVVMQELQNVAHTDAGAERNTAAVPVATARVLEEKARRKDLIQKHIYEFILWQSAEKKPLIPIEETRARLKKVIGAADYAELERMPEAEKQKGIYAVEQEMYERNVRYELEELFLNLELETQQEARQQILKELHEYEVLGEEEKSGALLQKLQDISAQIDSIKNRK